MKKFVFALSSVLLIASANAASYKCAKAQTNVEKIICTSSELSELDSRLDQKYNSKRSSLPPNDIQLFVSEQIKWLKNVRSKCADSSCLMAAYTSRIQALSPPSSSAPLKLISEFSNFRTDDYQILSEAGKLYFSQYDKSGNNFDVVSLDIADLKSEVVVAGHYGAKFVAQDDRYLVFNEKAQLTNPLIVLDRKTGKQLGKIKLQQIVSWAKIDKNHLVAIQGAWLSGGYQSTAHALIFELPNLKVLKTIDIVGANDVQFWQGKILSLGYNLAAYDLELNTQFEISLPTRERGINNASCAATWPLRVYGDKAVIVANCGEILVYDLPSRKLERTIPRYSHFYAVTILDGLIFTVPTSEPLQKDNAHVFDLYTGKELAVLPINGTDLFAKGNRLLAVKREFAKQSPMTLYEVNTSAIRSGQWRIEQAVSQCKAAEDLLVNTKDLYTALNLCRTSGIEGFVGDETIPPAVIPVLKKYGLWLSQTFDRGDDAIRLLEKLRVISPDQDIVRAISEVRFRTKVMAGQEAVSQLSLLEKQTEFGKTFALGSQVKNATTKTIEFGSFSNLFHFSGDKIYVGRYGCKTRTCGGGTSVGVLDRNTLDEIADIPIAPDDEEYQDNVESITSDDKYVYLSVSYRYEQEGRPNFFIIDKKSLKVIKKAQAESISTLIFDSGKLITCGCHFTTEQQCAEIDPITLNVTNIPDKLCIQNEPDNRVVVSFERGSASTSKFVAVTKEYLVAHDQWGKGTPFVFYPRVGGSSITSQGTPSDALEWPASVDGNSIVIRDAVRGGQLIKLVNIPSGSTQTLFGVPVTSSRFPISALNGNALYIGLGRDLLVYDLNDHHLKRYIKDFITAGFKDNGFELDANRIDRLIIDQGRLIALTFYGVNSRIINLGDL
ncbi:MAG: lysozyme inhibitor LprI family protein [Gallionella sp.]